MNLEKELKKFLDALYQAAIDHNEDMYHRLNADFSRLERLFREKHGLPMVSNPIDIARNNCSYIIMSWKNKDEKRELEFIRDAVNFIKKAKKYIDNPSNS